VRVQIRAGRGSGTPKSSDLRWVTPAQLPGLGISSLARKSLRAAGIAIVTGATQFRALTSGKP
jgi:hypothetical protein